MNNETPGHGADAGNNAQASQGGAPTSRSSLADRLSYLWYEATYWATMAGMSLGFSLRTEGRQHVPRRGPAILVANHQSFLDPVLVGLAARRHLHFLARKTLFRRRALAVLLGSLNAVPIDHEGLGIAGLRTIMQQLREGRAVVVFPEGERTRTGHVQPLRSGIHLLITRTRAPVLPVGIAGAYDAWSRWRRVPIAAPLFLPAGKGTIAVAIGEPIDPGRYSDMLRERMLDDLFIELQKVQSWAERLRRK